METRTDTIEARSINTIRALAMDAVEKAASGHPGTAMALAPLAYVLYRKVMKHNPDSPLWPDRDRFILSAGHASMLQYAMLHLTGYDLSLDDLKNFRQWESKTPGHPEFSHTPGIEATTGPLGQGFANGVGMAMAEEFLADRYNGDQKVVDHHIYAICSDGDLMEGVTQEAASLAGQNGLGKLVYIYDDNRITIDGDTAKSFDGEDKGKRFEAYGWHVLHLDDSEDVEAIEAAINEAKSETERPSLIVMRSHIGYPAPNAVDTAAAHGAPLGADEIKAAKEAMGMDPDKDFAVSDEVYEHMSCKSEGAKAESGWNDLFSGWKNANSELADEWEAAWSKKPLPGYEDALPVWSVDDDALATRKAGGAAMAAFEEFTPTMIGGAADLVGSTNTKFDNSPIFMKGEPGRNIAFGIREHAMGSAVNGIELHGGMVRPYGSTFLIFSDYMRPAVRLSALMSIRVAWVFTHDSVGVGEDGPTHQPIEHYMALRAIPNLTVIRPGDANETSEAWKTTFNTDGPVAMLLTRQNLPILDPEKTKNASKGAYVYQDTDGTPDVILIGTGSEVSVAIEAAKNLAEKDISVRVVSMPSWEVFDRQDQGYKDEVLPPSVEARVSVESGITVGWERYIGFKGRAVGIDKFGASAPGDRVMQEYGITPQNVANVALDVLGRGDEAEQDGGTPGFQETDPEEGHS